MEKPVDSLMGTSNMASYHRPVSTEGWKCHQLNQRDFTLSGFSMGILLQIVYCIPRTNRVYQEMVNKILFTIKKRTCSGNQIGNGKKLFMLSGKPVDLLSLPAKIPLPHLTWFSLVLESSKKSW